MAVAAGARFRCAAHGESAFASLPVEDLRQPAAQPGPGRVAAAHRRDVAAAGRRPRGLAAGAGGHSAAGLAGHGRRRLAQARRTASPDASAGDREVLSPPGGPGFPHAGFPALRRVRQRGRHRPHARADGLHPSPAAGMADLQRHGTNRANRFAGLLRDDVDRAGGRVGGRRRGAAPAAAHLEVALPLLGLWLAAPAIAWRVSQSIEDTPPVWTDDQRRFLHRTARKTWWYFEKFVTAQENWLPPDNFQETPVPVIATRTSPTNLGLALLANLSARDFGYLSTGGLIRRTQDAFLTMEKLERHRGHFYNWYDTRTLQPLRPLYVSSVDSGNLSGHLLTLGAGLRELADEKVFTPQVWSGLRDTLQLLVSLLPARHSLAGLDAELATAPGGVATGTGPAGPVGRAGKPAAAGIGRQASRRARVGADLAAQLRRAADRTAVPGSVAGRPRCGSAGAIGHRAARRAGHVEADRRARAGDYDGAAFAAGGPSPMPPARRGRPWPRRCARARRGRGRAWSPWKPWRARATNSRQSTTPFSSIRRGKLISIGFNVAENRRDVSCYDLLASEARLCSYVAIALGQVPQDHWFSLGRLLVTSGGEPLLVSWSGSMFEYLMPLLIMPELRKDAARPHLSRGGAAADRLRQPARRAVGDLGIGLQPHRSPAHLPVPGLRRARSRPEARAGRGFGDRALCQRHGLDGFAGGGLRKPAAPGRGRAGGRLRFL